MTKAIETLTEKELFTAWVKAAEILVEHHQVEFRRIREVIEFNARQAKANKKDRN